MFYNKFLRDNIIIGTNICSISNDLFGPTDKTGESVSFYKKEQIVVRNGVREPEVKLKGPTKTYENIMVESVPYTRIIFNFNNCHSLVVAKVITDLTDCVNFTSDIYGYDKDGNEVLLIKFPIGSVVNIINSGNSDIDYIVSGYIYEREIKEFKYVIKRFEDGELISMINISEEGIKPSRGNNLDILLGLN
jgi:hypothetical protein